MAVERRNLELKARDRDPGRSLAACRELGVEAAGVLVQRDTYFRAGRGRLKLREEPGMVAQLIAYERPDRTDARESRFHIVEVERPAELKAALAAVLGTQVEVAKERRLFLWDGVRIHLDEVEGLGDFIEFEAAASAAFDLRPQEAKLEMLREAFGIVDADLLAGSYCDLLTEQPA